MEKHEVHYTKDMDRIQSRMNDARSRMERQLEADAVKSDMCDDIIKHKASIPGLPKKIRLLETEDPDLFNYIRKLEFIQNGIWCLKCDSIKSFGVTDDQKRVEVLCANPMDNKLLKMATQLLDENEKLVAELDSVTRKLTHATEKLASVDKLPHTKSLQSGKSSLVVESGISNMVVKTVNGIIQLTIDLQSSESQSSELTPSELTPSELQFSELSGDENNKAANKVAKNINKQEHMYESTRQSYMSYDLDDSFVPNADYLLG